MDLSSLEAARAELRRGAALATSDGLDQIARLAKRWLPLHPGGASAQEKLPLFDAKGNALAAGKDGPPLVAPRWLCHLLGLRHRSAHIVLAAPAPSDLLLLQVRASWKDTAPGRLDTTSGGHVPEAKDPRNVALDELEQELGLVRESIDGPLTPIGTILTIDASTPRVRDVEVIDAFVGRLHTSALAKLKFRDGEVTRVVLAPPDECWRLLSRGAKRVASGARAVLPKALEALERGEF